MSSTRLPTRKWLILAFASIVSLNALGQSAGSDEAALFGEFEGTSPSGEAIRPMLGIAPDAKSDLVEWKLTLLQDPKTRAPTRYRLQCDYGEAVPNQPGLGGGGKTRTRQGRWTIGRGSKSNPEAMVFELDGAVSFLQLDRNILHALNHDRTLMVGHGGWSYTLYRREAAEPRVAAAGAAAAADMSYTIAPVAAGPAVFGVFEGRSPCQGIARELNLGVPAGCIKAKWRVTLLQDPVTSAPTSYTVEGTLFRQGARKGHWSILRGPASSVIYQLEGAQGGAMLFLLQGDDNVLFFLDKDRRPLVGSAEFSYTLNRRAGQ